MTHCRKLSLRKYLALFSPFFIATASSLLLVNNVVKAAKLDDGVWTQSAAPGTTTITFTNTGALEANSDIVITFPSSATVDGAGTNVSVTGQTTPTRSNNTQDNTITITLDGTLAATTAVTIEMTDALASYTASTFAQESLAINTQDASNNPVDFGVAIITNDNTTLITSQVPLFVTMAVDDTSIELGTLSVASVSEQDQTYTVNSNNRSGVTLQIVADGDMDDGFGNTINAVADGTVTAGSEEYGITIDNVTGFTIEAPFDAGDDEIPQIAADIASTTTEVSNAIFDVNYKASIAGTTIAGSYNQVVTVTIATNS